MSKPMSFRPDKEVEKKLNEESKKEGRSVSNLINYILKLHYKLLPPKEDKHVRRDK